MDKLAALDGPVIVTANHSSHLDAPLILCSLPPAWRRAHARHRRRGLFLRRLVARRRHGARLRHRPDGAPRRARASSSTPGELLDAGWNLVVFPEGTRAADGQLGSFKSGTARLAMSAGVPVVPIGLRGAFSAMPRGRGWPVAGRKPVSVRFGAPLRLRADENAKHLTDRIRTAVSQLCAEDASTWWESIKTPAGTPAAASPEVARWRRVWDAGAPVTHEAPLAPDPWATD